MTDPGGEHKYNRPIPCSIQFIAKLGLARACDRFRGHEGPHRWTGRTWVDLLGANATPPSQEDQKALRAAALEPEFDRCELQDKYEALRLALNALGELPTVRAHGWDEYALNQRAALLLSQKAVREQAAKLVRIRTDALLAAKAVAAEGRCDCHFAPCPHDDQGKVIAFYIQKLIDNPPTDDQ